MRLFSIHDAAKKWGLAEQTIRRYCREGLIPDSFFYRIPGKTYMIIAFLTVGTMGLSNTSLGFPIGSDSKESTCNTGDPGCIDSSYKF